MVGDLRDRESAMLAIQAAMGHLVIAGMVADSPVSAIRRLTDLGVEPYLLASALRGVISQRKIWRLCPQCRKVADRQALELPTPEVRQFVEAHKDAAFCWPAGCDQCNGLGYYGATCVFSVIKMDESLRSIISNGTIIQASHPALRYNGLGGMLDDALEKAAAGITTLEEVVRLQLELMI
jgi:type II secretory ATPase GspE/PulE/Tfp pilus assembly ATPase PilB-like protein